MADNEVDIAVMHERQKQFDKAIGSISDDLHALRQSYEKLTESTQRIAVLESAQAKTDISLTKVWERVDSQAKDISEHKLAIGNKAVNMWIDAVKWLAAAAIVGVLAHYGVKVPGME